MICGTYVSKVIGMLTGLIAFFFFSSRRRHTRYWRDWSSDVCSSDLPGHLAADLLRRARLRRGLVRGARGGRAGLRRERPLLVPRRARDLGALREPRQIGRASCRERV